MRGHDTCRCPVLSVALPAEVEIAKRPDGSDWLLGSGGFGKVGAACRRSACLHCLLLLVCTQVLCELAV